MNNLAKRIREIAHHCDANNVVIGAYWRGYTQNTAIEVRLFGEDIFSDKFFFARTFGGGLSVSKTPREIGFFAKYVDPWLWKIFSPKMPAVFRNNFLSDLLFRWLSGKLFRQDASPGYEYFCAFVNCYYALLKDDIEKYNLKTMAESSLPIRLTHTPTRDRFCVCNG